MIFIYGTAEPYVTSPEFELEKLERLMTALNATSEAGVYAAFDLKAPAVFEQEARLNVAEFCIKR